MLKLLSSKTLRKFIRNPAHSFAAGKDRLSVQLAASYLNGYSPYPKNLTFFLTYRCNLRCNVCGQWGLTGYAKKLTGKQLADEVDIATLKRVLDEAALFKPQITMCGGETLLYKNWFEFMSYVKSKGMECILTTNGTLLEQNAEKIVEAGLDKLSLSLDGPEKIHNKARGREGVFQKALSGISLINDFKKKKNTAYPKLEIGCTISDQNYAHLDKLIAIAESLDVSTLILLHLFFLNEREFGRQESLFRKLFQTESLHWSGYRYNPRQLDLNCLTGKLHELRKYRGKVQVIIYPDFTDEEIRQYYERPVFLSSSYKNICLAPWTTVYILPNGDISPCSSFVAGNIRDKRFKEIWNNQEMKRFRRELRNRKFFPVCPRCCEFYKH